VRRVREASRKLAGGDLDARVPDAGARGDDMGMLGHDFNRMAEQLKSLLQTRNELLRDISHELRSPLARLQVALELGRSQLDDAAFDRIEREIERMDGLIGELLALARLEAGTVPLRRDPVDLSELLRDVCEDAAYEGAASERKVELTTDGSATLLGDPGLLQSAFDNVIRNAVRHTPSGSSVRVDLRCANREAYVTVIDSGPGVPPEALTRIFDPFTRVSAARERPLLVAEQLAFQERFGQGGAVDLDERSVGARALFVQHARDELFAGSALASYERRRPRRGHAAYQIAHLLHLRRGADQLRIGRSVPAGVPRYLERSIHYEQNVLALERLQEEVGGPASHRVHGERDRAMRRENDDRHVRSLANPIEQREPVHGRHAEVGDAKVETSLRKGRQRPLR
jgi:hypothetical protein